MSHWLDGAGKPHLTAGTAINPPNDWVLADSINRIVQKIDELEKRIQELEKKV